MVRWSIRVVLAAENDLLEVASDPGAGGAPGGAWGGTERLWEAARGTRDTNFLKFPKMFNLVLTSLARYLVAASKTLRI